MNYKIYNSWHYLVLKIDDLTTEKFEIKAFHQSDIFHIFNEHDDELTTKATLQQAINFLNCPGKSVSYAGFVCGFASKMNIKKLVENG